MSESPAIRLTWKGSGTVAALAQCLEDHGAVELDLAPEFHHSVFKHLYPDAEPGEPEQVDVQGDAGLLEKLAEIRGLEDMGKLVPALAAAGAEVYVESPAPCIQIRLPPGAAFAYR